jgi:tetratricopeptide (TPR) repeat protein
MSRRVEVIYFPKRVRARRTPFEVPVSETHITGTVEFRPAPQDAEVETEPHGRPLPSRPSRSKARKAARRTPSSPALAQVNGQVHAPAPPASLEGLSRRELFDVALFGHQLFEWGRLQDARRVFEALVGLEGSDAWEHTMLGTVYLALGDESRALALFESGLELDPSDLAARVYRAEIRIKQGKLDAARRDLERVSRQGSADDPFVGRALKLRQILAERPARRGRKSR